VLGAGMGTNAGINMCAVSRGVVNSIQNGTMSGFEPPPKFELSLPMVLPMPVPGANIVSNTSSVLRFESCLSLNVDNSISVNGNVTLPVVSSCSSDILGSDKLSMSESLMNAHVKVPVAMVTKHIEKWKSELLGDENETYLLNGLTHGFNIIDSPLTPKSTFRRNYRSTGGINRPKVETRLLEEIQRGHYIPTPVRPSVVSSLGAIPKDVSDVRLIHDLSRPDGGVNAYAFDTSVSYTSIDAITRHIKAGSFLAKVDLKNAYRSIPISESCYGLTGVSWKFTGDTELSYLFDSRLPFGGSMSCRIFQSVTDSICRMMARRGHIVKAYLDDIICVSDSETECQLNFDTLVQLIEDLGLEINWTKVCDPTRVITYLGVVIDCVERSLSLPLKKVTEIALLIDRSERCKKMTKLDLQKLLGKLNWAARVIKGGRTFMRSLINLTCKVKESHHYVRLTAASRVDLSWWKHCFVLFNGTCKFHCDIPLPTHVFATDACENGGGAFFGADWFYTSWSSDYPEMNGKHINELELFTVLLALRRWGPCLENVHLRVRSDNMATVSALNKSTSRSPVLMPHIKEIFWLCVKFNIHLSSVHIPGVENLLADRISRLDEKLKAFDARLLLANFSASLISCNEHMSLDSFIYLQEAWMVDFKPCAMRQRYSSGMHSRVPQKRSISVR
jgi:hypothetical protein